MFVTSRNAFYYVQQYICEIYYVKTGSPDAHRKLCVALVFVLLWWICNFIKTVMESKNLNMSDIQMLPSSVTFFEGQLCYSGQKCQKIPEALVKLYGPKVHSLDLSYNEIVTLRGLEGFPLLRELVLDNNQVTDTLVLPYLPHLHTLSLNKNKIYDIEALLVKIQHNLPALTYLSLLGNRACPNQLSDIENDEEDYQRYRYFVLYHLPNLEFLDSNKARESEKIEARRRGQFMKIIRPTKNTNEFENLGNNTHQSTKDKKIFTPLPKTLRNPEDYKGAYGKCRYRYNGKHSEGNRFISNNDL